MPARHAHAALEHVDRTDQHVLGLAPAAQLAQRRRVDAVAVVAEEHRGARGRADQTAASQDVGPRTSPVEVRSEVAGGEERADGLPGSLDIVDRPADQRHGLVQQRHALGQTPGLDAGQPRVSQGSGLQVHIAEPPSAVQRKVRPREQHVRVIDVAAHRRHRHPTLLDARWLVLDHTDRPLEPGAGRRQVTHGDREQVAQPGASQRGLPPIAGGGELTDRSGQVRRCVIDLARLHSFFRQPHRGCPGRRGDSVSDLLGRVHRRVRL